MFPCVIIIKKSTLYHRLLQLKPCRDFCEDVYLVCLQELMRLDTNWEYHRKIIKILAEYILKRVDLQVLLNTFHTELKANIDLAILQYSSYRKQVCFYSLY